MPDNSLNKDKVIELSDRFPCDVVPYNSRFADVNRPEDIPRAEIGLLANFYAEIRGGVLGAASLWDDNNPDKDLVQFIEVGSRILEHLYKELKGRGAERGAFYKWERMGLTRETYQVLKEMKWTDE